MERWVPSVPTCFPVAVSTQLCAHRRPLFSRLIKVILLE